ncbi:radical SAM protein [Streptomyces sp. 8N114]|uniref:radical SAM protein n=1 Tax=Streptomyces sp. 8N114 TaxID=3457419 RepID=UPI003FD01F98
MTKTDRGRQVARGMDAADIERKVRSGERLTREDGIALYDCDDLAWLGGLAHHTRTRHNGDVAYFAVHRSLEVTDVAEAVERATRWAADGVTELRPAPGGGSWRDLVSAVRALRDALPEGVALTVRTADAGVEDVLDELVDAGVTSLSIEGDSDAELPWEDQARVHRLAHHKGLTTMCTMRYGSAEDAADRAAYVEQVLRLRELQDETGGFHVFVPLLQDGPRGATGAEVLKTFAVARLLFDNVPHVAVDWALHSVQTAQLVLQHGADEMAGQVVNSESETAQDADALTREDLLDLIRDTGFRPVERDARHGVLRSYEGPDPQRREAPQPMRV